MPRRAPRHGQWSHQPTHVRYQPTEDHEREEVGKNAGVREPRRCSGTAVPPCSRRSGGDRGPSGQSAALRSTCSAAKRRTESASRTTAFDSDGQCWGLLYRDGRQCMPISHLPVWTGSPVADDAKLQPPPHRKPATARFRVRSEQENVGAARRKAGHGIPRPGASPGSLRCARRLKGVDLRFELVGVHGIQRYDEVKTVLDERSGLYRLAGPGAGHVDAAIDVERGYRGFLPLVVGGV